MIINQNILAILRAFLNLKKKNSEKPVAHCAQNSKLCKKVYIYILNFHMKVNGTILKIP